GAFLLGISTLPFLWNVYRSNKYGEVVTADDPWGHATSREWPTSGPPPRHNFTVMPRIRSERPAFEAHYPELAERLELEAHSRGRGPARPAVGRPGRRTRGRRRTARPARGAGGRAGGGRGESPPGPLFAAPAVTRWVAVTVSGRLIP